MVLDRANTPKTQVSDFIASSQLVTRGGAFDHGIRSRCLHSFASNCVLSAAYNNYNNLDKIARTTTRTRTRNNGGRTIGIAHPVTLSHLKAPHPPLLVPSHATPAVYDTVSSTRPSSLFYRVLYPSAQPTKSSVELATSCGEVGGGISPCKVKKQSTPGTPIQFRGGSLK